jgi:UDP-GlcNAc:undecaprenyl-phosphate/decaprenyl-phosphate GlcNAc-1-phosphate transferase
MSDNPIVVASIGLSVSLLLIPLLLRFHGNARWTRRSTDWHHAGSQVPRLGGAILMACLVVIEMWIATCRPESPTQSGEHGIILAGSLAMFALGFWDDLRRLSAGKKLILQLFIASVVCLAGVTFECLRTPFASLPVQLGVWGPVLSIVWLVSVPNLINLIDGIDGLAAGICLLLMLLLALIAHQQGNFELLSCGMAGALLGFLRYNLPPAKIYLGDSGAYFLGFQIAGFALVNSNRGAAFEVVAATLILLAFPLTDAVFTLLRRGSRGLPLFRPDREHLHHRLLTIRRSRLEVILWIYGLNFVLFCIGLLIFCSPGEQWPWLLGAAALLVTIAAGCCSASSPMFAVHQKLWSCWRMRRHVHYALSLVRWIELEAQRRSGPDQLWKNLVFTADKLGFAALTLTLEREQREWQNGSMVPGAARRYCSPNEMHSVLELRAPVCRFRKSNSRPCCDPQPGCPLTGRGCLAEPRAFDTISDLVAETWNKSTAGWHSHLPAEIADGSQRLTQSVGKPAAHWLKATAMFLVMFLTPGMQAGVSSIATNDFERILRKAPSAELPAAARALVKAARPEARTATAVAVVKLAVRINPAATTFTVCELVRADPASAAAVSETATQEEPELACEIARAASFAAPARSGEIVTAIGTVVPLQLRDVAAAAAGVAPRSARSIIQAIEVVNPELKPFLDREVALYGAAEPSVERCYSRAEQAFFKATRSQPDNSRQINPRATSPRGSDSKPPKGGGHPPGGRNYAKP